MWGIPDEQLIIPCCECSVPILTWWAPNNQGMLEGEYVLVADWVFHPKCYDKMLERGGMIVEAPPLLTKEGNVRPLAELELEVIGFAIKHHHGNMSEVARNLRIGRSTLYRKLDMLLKRRK